MILICSVISLNHVLTIVPTMVFAIMVIVFVLRAGLVKIAPSLVLKDKLGMELVVFTVALLVNLRI